MFSLYGSMSKKINEIIDIQNYATGVVFMAEQWNWVLK